MIYNCNSNKIQHLEVLKRFLEKQTTISFIDGKLR